MKLTLIILILIFSSMAYAQDWSESSMDDNVPIDRPVIDDEDQPLETESSEEGNYEYDY